MKLYLEPSVLAKVLKSETDSNRMVEILSNIDEDKGWTGSGTLLVEK